MNQVLLIPNPHTVVHKGRIVPEPYVPVGLLRIATELTRAGVDVEILDINRVAQDASYSNIPEAIADRDPAIIGFSTMCNRYPTTVRLAEQCKALRPRTHILFGGPQASATDLASLNAFPFVDVIVRGEAEQTITPIVMALVNGSPLQAVPGISFRMGRDLVRKPAATALVDLDTLPELDYRFYPWLDDSTDMPLEVGRGCPFRCTFCSTKSFWRQRDRFYSAETLVRSITELRNRYGTSLFMFHHDHFTASRARVLQFCEALANAGLDIRWRCSARADSLDGELINRMAYAGCSGIFLGIETGSQTMQRKIKKGLPLAQIHDSVQRITAAGMSFVASFMMGFPDETMDDLVKTMLLMTEMRFAGDGRESVQLHLLAPVAGSSLLETWRSSLLLDEHLSDITSVPLHEQEQRLVRSHPEIFSAFYHFDTPELDRELLVRANYLFVNLRLFPYTTYVLWKDTRFDYPRMLMDHVQGLDMPRPAWRRYDEALSISRISAFLRSVLLELGYQGHYVLEVLRYETAVRRLVTSASDTASALVAEEFHYDIEALIDAIAASKPKTLPQSLPLDRHWLLFIPDRGAVKTTRVGSAAAARLREQSS